MPHLSIFTPSHSPKYLPELARSIASQTFKDWEWILLINGPLTPEIAERTVRPALNGDGPKLRIVQAPDSLPRTIGALKGAAARACSSEFLVEADHDDLFLPDCLSEVADAFEDADFVYSNMAPFYTDTRDGDGIWCATAPVRPVRVFGRTLWEGIVVPPSAHMLFKAGTCGPVHVRAWRRSTYEAVGGHNPKLTLMDDCELIARTYISGARFKHIDRCLYLYRVERGPGGVQTSSNVSARLGAEESETYYKRLLPAALLRWSSDKGLLIGDTPEALQSDRENAFGAFFLGPSFSAIPAAQALAKMHALLAHGGWLVINDVAWNRDEILKLCYPKHKPVTRYQLHHLEGGVWSPFTRKEEPLVVHLSAKKFDEPLPGEDFWHPAVNEVDVRKLSPIAEGMGCKARLEDGRIKMSGSSAEEVVAVVQTLSPFYEELVEVEDEARAACESGSGSAGHRG